LASYVDELATGRGYRVLLCNVGSDVEKEEAALQMLMSMNADGVIIASGNDGIRPALETCSIPVVALDAMFAGRGVAACVYCDHYSGGRMAMEHLLECGCRDIVCIQGPMAKYSARARYEGYRDVCREHGIAEQVVSCDYDFDAGIAMTETLLKNFSQVDGIIACNDMVAISTFKVLHKKNIPVPEKIQLIGFDDIYFSQLISPELSTIRQPIREMAEKAVELIMDDKDDEKKGGSFVLPTSLVIRETTKMRGRG